MKRFCALVAGLVTAATLAGCGGGGNDQEAVIEATLRRALLSHDPAKCTDALTETVIEQVTGESGAEALEECEEQANERENDTKAITISAVEVDDAGASAKVAFVDGSFTGQTILVSLVDESGRWKLDRFVRITKFNREYFLAGAAINLADSEEMGADQSRCIVERLESKSREEIEAVLFNRSDEAKIELVRACPDADYDQPADAQIEHAIDALYRGDEPSVCVEFATQSFLEASSGERGTGALVACVDQLERGLRPESLEVSEIHVHGSEASAKLSTKFEERADEALILGLVTEGGHWKVDQVLRLIAFDRLGFARGVLEGFTKRGIRVNQAVSACVLEKARRIPLRQLEDMIFPLDRELTIKLLGPCAEASEEAPPPT